MKVVAIDEVATFLPELGLPSGSPFFILVGPEVCAIKRSKILVIYVL